MTKEYIVLALLMTGMLFSGCQKEDSVTSSDNGTEQPSPTPTPSPSPTPGPEPTPQPTTSGFNSDGASYALFSVSENRQVHFSRGNMQYNAVSDTWRFAENQYDYIGDANYNISETYDGWIDLFGWGTSGWNGGAVAYQPWSSSQVISDYNPGGSAYNDLTGECAEADWAWHNPISNGGNRNHLWRTMTTAEWQYLLGQRADAENKYGFATIDGQYRGLVILPDEWTLPEGLTFSPKGSSYNRNTYSLDEWQRMQTAGAIFLPAAGNRWGTSGDAMGGKGYYWLVSRTIQTAFIYCIAFTGNIVYPDYYSARYYGYSVRPVTDNN